MKFNKKITIIIITTILILSSATGIIILKNVNKSIKVADEVNTTLQENVIEDEVVNGVDVATADEIIDNKTNVEDKIDKNTTTQKQEIVKEQKKSSTQTKTTEVVTKTQISSTKKSTTPSQSSSSQTTVVTPSVPKEEFKRNDQMINRIKSIIQNNETELMKIYGYTIVVDSSIKTLTNQFTFYEDRVINNIRNKFGTIKIYAEDCYKNGQFIMTECYIL